MDMTELGSDLVLMSGIHNTIISEIASWSQRPYTIPDSYTWIAHLTSTYPKFQPPITELVEIQGVSSESIALHVLLARAGFVHHRLLLPTLAILRYAQSKQLQDICVKTLASIPVARSLPEIGAMLGDEDMVGAFFGTTHLNDEYIGKNIVFYFRLLVANIMLCNDCEVSKRQSALSFLSRYPDWDEKLKYATENTDLPNEERILEHVAEDTQGKPESECIRDTIQLALDFCQADPSKYSGPEGGLLDSDEPLRWADKLQAIKNAFQSSCSPTGMTKSNSDQDSGAMLVGNGTQHRTKTASIGASEQMI
ncbi:hypothetical protein RhiJN_22459 [Ceratobasidium sp. AG-Ba]|nr:hypothetical protein RhiJN_22459 [Ceratobasidium sp. AG-Ba]